MVFQANLKDVSCREYQECFIPNYPGGRQNYHPLSENRDLSRNEPPLDLRPVCKFKFVHCGPVEEKQSTLSFLVEAWQPNEVWEHLFPNSEIEIFIDFCLFLTNFLNFQKKSQGTSLKARGLKFWILPPYIHI